jgi:hypothetical protein
MKKLITSGCSFSECITPGVLTWPYHLSKMMPEYELISGAIGSQGNGLISRSIIYHVSEALKHVPASDIFVGIMWSGFDRHDVYNQQAQLSKQTQLDDLYMENPTGFIPEQEKHWIILSHNWTNQYSRQWYTMLHDTVGAQIYTLEHILRTQWFLQKHQIQYFMTTYQSTVLDEKECNHVEARYLYDQIDFTKFLPVTGELEWIKKSSGMPYPSRDFHPSNEHHQAFAEKVILPFLKISQFNCCKYANV